MEGSVPEIKEKYKQSVFVVKTKETHVSIPSNGLFEIVSMKPVKGITEIEIKLTAAISENELIREIMPYCSLLSFEEKLPGMDEIFIKVVKGNI